MPIHMNGNLRRWVRCLSLSASSSSSRRRLRLMGTSHLQLRWLCSRWYNRDVGVSGDCATGRGVGIGKADGGNAVSAASAHPGATHAHAHAHTTSGVDDDTRMTSDNLTVHGDSGHLTGDMEYLLALHFDASGSSELVPVGEL